MASPLVASDELHWAMRSRHPPGGFDTNTDGGLFIIDTVLNGPVSLCQAAVVSGNQRQTTQEEMTRPQLSTSIVFITLLGIGNVTVHTDTPKLANSGCPNREANSP